MSKNGITCDYECKIFLRIINYNSNLIFSGKFKIFETEEKWGSFKIDIFEI